MPYEPTEEDKAHWADVEDVSRMLCGLDGIDGDGNALWPHMQEPFTTRTGKKVYLTGRGSPEVPVWYAYRKDADHIVRYLKAKGWQRPT